MTSADSEADFGAIAIRIHAVVGRLGSRLSARNAAQTLEFADFGEPELAVEWMADDLVEMESATTADERVELTSLAERFGSESALRAIGFCPVLPT